MHARAGGLRETQEKAVEVAAQDLMTVAFRKGLDAPAGLAPPDRVAGGAKEAGGLDRVLNSEELEDFLRAGRQRLGKGMPAGRSGENGDRVSPLGEQAGGRGAGRSTADDEYVDGGHGSEDRF